jgi:hypothetical protein
MNQPRDASIKIRLVIDSITPLAAPNQSGALFGVTAGIARDMEATPPVEPADATPYAQGGGNLNGSANTAHLMGQAGTAAQRIAVARRPPNSGNYCGVV